MSTKIIPAPKLYDKALKDMFDYRLGRLRQSMVLVTDTGVEILSHYPFEDKLIH